MITAGVELDLVDLAAVKGKAKRAVIIGANRAAKPVKAAVVSEAEKIRRHGFSAKAVGTKTRTYPSGSFVTVIGPKMSYSRTKGKRTRGKRKGEKIRHVPYLYAWLLNKGTKRSKAKPFIQRAWSSTKAAYESGVEAAIAAEMQNVFPAAPG